MTEKSFDKRKVGDFASTDGAVAVEFAFILPILLIIILGIVDGCIALVNHRNVAQTAQSLAWTANVLVVPPTANTPANISNADSITLTNIINLTSGKLNLAKVNVSIRRLARSSTSGSLVETILYQSGSSFAPNDTGIDVDLKMVTQPS